MIAELNISFGGGTAPAFDGKAITFDDSTLSNTGSVKQEPSKVTCSKCKKLTWPYEMQYAAGIGAVCHPCGERLATHKQKHA